MNNGEGSREIPLWDSESNHEDPSDSHIELDLFSCEEDEVKGEEDEEGNEINLEFEFEETKKRVREEETREKDIDLMLEAAFLNSNSEKDNAEWELDLSAVVEEEEKKKKVEEEEEEKEKEEEVKKTQESKKKKSTPRSQPSRKRPIADNRSHAYMDLFSKFGSMDISSEVTSASSLANAVLTKYLEPVLDDVCSIATKAKISRDPSGIHTASDSQLPFASFDHDSSCLYERHCIRDDDGRVLKEMRACSNGDKCIGKTGMIRSPYVEENGDLFSGRVLQAYPLPGQPPEEAEGKCLLCLRISLTFLIKGVFDASQTDVFDPRMILQTFYNSNDINESQGVHEYHDHVLIFPNGEGRFNGLVAPVAMYMHPCLFWDYDHEKGLWKVDQRLYRKTSSVLAVDLLQKKGKK